MYERKGCKQFFERFLFACLDLKLPREKTCTIHEKKKAVEENADSDILNLPVFWGFPRCDAVDWLDVWPCPNKNHGPMGVDLHNEKQPFLNVGHTSGEHPHASEHLNLGLSFRPRDHGISKNPRLLASQMSEGVKGESGD